MNSVKILDINYVDLGMLNLPLFHVDESRMMKKYRQVKEANYALYRVLNKEKIEDHHFLFRETLEEYIDNIGVGHFEDNARWLEVISSDGRLVEETIEKYIE